ncbi:MAG: hypothetical protein KY456_14750, partial [Chloroflexi bacterium]|nr:hypothetical protein [Chloroflexota bacterium]
VIHLLPAMTDGWKGIRRGLPQSYLDLEMAAPGMGAGIWLGYQLRPLLAPVTLRAEPLPPLGQAMLALGVAAAGIVAVLAIERARSNAEPAPVSLAATYRPHQLL